MSRFVDNTVWKTYSSIFDGVWVASAYKVLVFTKRIRNNLGLQISKINTQFLKPNIFSVPSYCKKKFLCAIEVFFYKIENITMLRTVFALFLNQKIQIIKLLFVIVIREHLEKDCTW